MPGSDARSLTEVQKWKIYAETCKWTDQKTGKMVNNGIERVIEGAEVVNIYMSKPELRREGKAETTG